MPTAQTSPPLHAMQCMEVWGGNGSTDNGVTMPGLDIWVCSRPADGSREGGDIHYVSSCGTGRIARLLIADVSGHGAEVAELATTFRMLFRRYVNYVDQTRFVGRLNTEFARLAATGMFATALVASYWAPTDCLVISNAGHHQPLACTARNQSWFAMSGGKRVTESDGGAAPSNLPLGIIEESIYTQTIVRCRVGDLIVLYTDGLIEALMPDGRQLGVHGLLAIIRTLDAANPQQLARDLIEAVQQRARTPLTDDATVLVLRPNGIAPRQSWSQRVGALRRFAAMLAQSRAPRHDPVPWPEPRSENIFGPFVPHLNRRWGLGAVALEDLAPT